MALATAGSLAGAEPALVGARACRFEAPPDWPRASLVWAGDCADGLADGRGVLRAYQRGAVVRSFFGRLQRGRLLFGVTSLDGGYQAGSYDAGRLVPGAGRDEIILAFDEAAAAARALAEQYRQRGQTASARFYDEQARQLAAQMD